MYGEPAGCCGPVDTKAPISVTINPEARVNVARTATRVEPVASGHWHPIDLTIVNDGYVTGQLVIEADETWTPGHHSPSPWSTARPGTSMAAKRTSPRGTTSGPDNASARRPGHQRRGNPLGSWT